MAAAVVALLLLSNPAAADERDELDKTGRRLGQVEAVLGDARADAGAVADAVDAAEVAVAVVRARLATATAELGAARRRRADALVALEAATDEVGRQEARLAWQVRRAYMTGGVSGLSVVVQANDLRDLMERAVTLSYVIRADQDVLGRLELARRRSVRLHQAMVEAEQDRTAAEAKVRRQLAELEQVRAVRQDAKHQLDARVARLAGAAAALRRRSAELRRLIHQEELARQRAAAAARAAAARAGGGGPPAGGSAGGSGRRCDLSGTSAAERWIILRESSGDPTADNPTSTAFGLGQLLLGNRILYLGHHYATTDCGRQLWAFRAYVQRPLRHRHPGQGLLADQRLVLTGEPAGTKRAPRCAGPLDERDDPTASPCGKELREVIGGVSSNFWPGAALGVEGEHRFKGGHLPLDVVGQLNGRVGCRLLLRAGRDVTLVIDEGQQDRTAVMEPAVPLQGQGIAAREGAALLHDGLPDRCADRSQALGGRLGHAAGWRHGMCVMAGA